jgi:hypothetical protein
VDRPESLQQLARYETGDALGPYLETHEDDRRSTPLMIKQYVPTVYDDYLASRQNTGHLSFDRIGPLHTAAISGSLMTGLPLLVVLARRQRGDLVLLAVIIAAGLLFNAAITGAVSNPIPRYQSRVVWLIVFWALLGTWAAVHHADWRLGVWTRERRACWRRRARWSSGDGTM